VNTREKRHGYITLGHSVRVALRREQCDVFDLYYGTRKTRIPGNSATVSMDTKSTRIHGNVRSVWVGEKQLPELVC
jgi:hypothetical protein